MNNVLIQHEAPSVTTLNSFKVQDEFAARQAAQANERAKQQRSTEDIKKDLSADLLQMKNNTDKLNQREVELANRERALMAQMASFTQDKADLEKRMASLERKYDKTKEANERMKATLRGLVE